MSEVPEIDLDEFEGRLSEGCVVVDVRESDEFEEVRVAGVLHIPLGTVPDRLDEIPTDRTVHVLCARGGRSAQAVAFLRENGVDAVNVAGGTLGWVESGRPVESGPR